MSSADLQRNDPQDGYPASAPANCSAASIINGYREAEAGIETLKSALTDYSSLKREASAIQAAFRQRREALEHFMAEPSNDRTERPARKETDDRINQ